jgi:hypothetical protein
MGVGLFLLSRSIDMIALIGLAARTRDYDGSMTSGEDKALQDGACRVGRGIGRDVMIME